MSDSRLYPHNGLVSLSYNMHANSRLMVLTAHSISCMTAFIPTCQLVSRVGVCRFHRLGSHTPPPFRSFSHPCNTTVVVVRYLLSIAPLTVQNQVPTRWVANRLRNAFASHLACKLNLGGGGNIAITAETGNKNSKIGYEPWLVACITSEPIKNLKLLMNPRMTRTIARSFRTLATSGHSLAAFTSQSLGPFSPSCLRSDDQSSMRA